ncbi:hypothetical protein PVAP13_6KG045935 [Panicum virgatum]|uniref:Uncharacterized protein n=1 Tax=Panicum virgatum TaxID=38727 RepID=A0A8T0RAB7_PANVG|nr:hypothetical protein PVAP13_6KG045935 [Panicum virgatum]
MIPSVDLSVRLYRIGLLRSRLRLCSPLGLAAELLCPGVGFASAPSLRRIRVTSSVCREVGDGAVEVAPALNLLRLMILRCGSALVSGGVVRCVMVGAPWRWLLQRFQALELLGGETNFSCLVGAGGRRCSARTEARKTKGFIVIFVFWRSSF